MSSLPAHEPRAACRFPALIALAVLSAAVAFMPRPANAAPAWELILDRPTPNFNGIDFVSDDEGWMTAGAGLLHTTDGGATWTEAAKISVGVVDFADTDHGWAAGLSGAIYATTDGGVTWERQDSGTNVHIYDVAAISPTEAWAVGRGIGFSDVVDFNPPGTFLHTTDGGATWREVDRPEDSEFTEIEFSGDHGWALGWRCPVDPEYGYCTGDGRTILLRTTDGGATWNESEPGDLSRLVFVDANHGWATGRECATLELCSAVAHRTSDGGRTWEQAAIPALEGIHALAFRNTQQGWLLGEHCEAFPCPVQVWSTADGGVTWHRAGELPQGRFQSTRALGIASDALIAAGFNTALRSTDGGASWKEMEHPALAFNDIDFADANNGYGLHRGILYSTRDAGRSWASLGHLPGEVFRVLFLNRDLGFAAGAICCEGDIAQFEIYRTTDGAATWQRVHHTRAFSSTFVHDAEFADDDHGWFALDGGFVFTEDGGATWRDEPLRTLGDNIIDADLADASHAWAVVPPRAFGQIDNRLARTENAGRTWEIVTPEGLNQLTRVEFVDAQHGWLLARVCEEICAQELQATTDGGETWRLLRSEEQLGYPTDLTFVDPLNGWLNESECDATGCRYHVLYSADGGHSWSEQLTGDLLTGEFEFLDADTGWFLLDPSRGIGIGGGPPNRTQLYHLSEDPDGLPKVGREGQPALPLMPIALLLGALALALGLGSAMIARRTSRYPGDQPPS